MHFLSELVMTDTYNLTCAFCYFQTLVSFGYIVVGILLLIKDNWKAVTFFFLGKDNLVPFSVESRTMNCEFERRMWVMNSAVR